MRWTSTLLPITVSACLAACGGPPSVAPPAEAPTVGEAEKSQATCAPARDPLNPLIVEWPGTGKVDLDVASQSGVVVVSYEDCVLKVLPTCKAGVPYEMKTVTPVIDRVKVENESELYAQLPLGVAALRGDLATHGRLDLSYVAVGQRVAPKPPAMLEGNCAGATHYVRAIMVGAYELDAIGQVKAGASATVGGNGGGLQGKESVSKLRGSGDLSACSQQGAKVESCNAVLQLGLAPLSLGQGGAVTAAGFGAGLGALAAVPTVQPIAPMTGGAASLVDADTDLLTLLDRAMKTEKGSVPAEGKAESWAALAAYKKGKHEYRAMAERRRDDWTQVAAAEARRREQAARVCEQHKADSEKLAKLLALTDAVTARQREAYQRELAQVYAPYKATLAECGAPPIGSAGGAGMASLGGGTFQMGERSDTVTVRPFQLDLTEVTVDAYGACVRAGACSAEGLSCSPSANYGVSGRGNHPINCVDWNQATAYCRWAGKRLPSEEEWEWAARGQARGTTYPWGNDAPASQLCWDGEGSDLGKGNRQSTCPVGAYPKGDAPGGIHDLAGNVWEWTDSKYDANARVYRGGGWLYGVASDVRAALRRGLAPGSRFYGLGFRCAR